MPRIDYPKLLSLGALHMGQYFPGAFTAIALPALFRQAGLPLEMFWLLALPAIPRWLKWLIALAVDNYGSVRIGGSLTAVETLGWSTTMMIASGLLIATALPAIFRPEPAPPLASRNRGAKGEKARRRA